MKHIKIRFKDGNDFDYLCDCDIVKVNLKDGFFMIETEQEVRYIDSSYISELVTVEITGNEY